METTFLQHHLNPLHIYCRMREVGVSKGNAQWLCRLYEKVIFKKLAVVRFSKGKEQLMFADSTLTGVELRNMGWG
jgi:hypothetical protein